MNKHIFVSRSLATDSPIRAIAIRHKAKITDRSLINFMSLEFDLPKSKWIFFYSKTGVKYFFARKNQLGNTKEYKIVCFGPGTAHYCSKFQVADIIYNAEPGTIASKLEDVLDQEKITFICGQKSLRSVQKNMNPNSYEETVVYDHHPKTRLDLASYDIAIMTSPMNVASFVENNGSAGQFIAIGKTTAKALAQNRIDCHIAPIPSEEGISETLGLLLAD